MTKSSRSKWKKMHRRERAKVEAPNVVARIEKLNNKLGLCATGGLSAVLPQDAETRFHFKQPEKRKAGERLVLGAMKTNPRAKSNQDAPHPATVNFETVPLAAPEAGKAVTVEDERRMEAFQQSALEMLANPDYTNDEPVEFTIGCNDDEHLTTSLSSKGAAVKKSTLKGKAATPNKSVISATKHAEDDGPKAAKLRSMEVQKGITRGDRKIKSDAPAKRLVSGGSAKKKK